MNIYLIVFFSILIPFTCSSQRDKDLQSINSSGNTTTMSSGSISYSIGQVFYSEYNSNSYYKAQGVQNTNNSNIIDPANNENSNNLEDIFIKPTIYPNPTIDHITLSIGAVDLKNQLLSYRLFNYRGKLIDHRIIKTQNSKIDLKNLSNSVYILQIFSEKKILQMFKVLKK